MYWRSWYFPRALDVHATQINEEMKMAAVQAIAELVAEDELNADYIIPAPFGACSASSSGLRCKSSNGDRSSSPSSRSK